MTCNCGVRCFVYETLEPFGDFYQRVLISSCGVYIIDGKKKSKCSFYNKKILKTGIVIDSPTIVKKEHEKYILNEDLDIDKKSRKDIESNIYLLKLAREYPINISNYISLINYNLRKLQYKPFFVDKESIEQLVERLEYNPDDIRKPVVFPTKCKSNCKSTKPRKTVNRKRNIKYAADFINLETSLEIEDSSDNSDENENENENENELENENENEIENEIDVSDIDCDIFEIDDNEEAFSD
tara:strand:- start:8494 stop:9216 length:723 start_codon:yes stop_codon:yes gene_type:complete